MIADTPNPVDLDKLRNIINLSDANLEISEGNEVMFSKNPDRSKLEELDNTQGEGDVVSEGVDKTLETRAEVKPPASVPRKAEIHMKTPSTDFLKDVRIDKEAVEDFKETPKMKANNTASQKFKFYASVAGQKLKTAWQYSKPKLIQSWHFTVSKVKVFVIWSWPKVKGACKKTFEVISNGSKKLYQAVKNRIQKKKHT